MEIKMPKYGDTMEAGEIVQWFVKAGDSVKKGDILCEVESDKLTKEIEAMADGVIDELLVQEGEEAAVGAPIARMR